MGRFLLRRLWQTIPTLAGVMVLLFVLFNQVGGDPAEQLAGLIADPARVAEIRASLGVDRPWWEQLGLFAREVITFDFGRSWATNEEVRSIFATRIGPTLTVMLPVLVLETVLGALLALAVAWVRGSLTDRAIMVACTVAMSVSFLVYIIVLQYLFGFRLGWFPVQGWSDDPLRNLLVYAPLPVICAVAVSIAPQVRLYRSFFLEELEQDYVRTARAKGLSERAVMLRHVLRNAAIPILTNVAIHLPGVFVGSFLLEKFFSIPGLGREVIAAVERSDFPVIKAVTVGLALLTILINLLVDVLYRYADPRVGYR
jgi:peptide/nickel transport system permease protein